MTWVLANLAFATGIAVILVVAVLMLQERRTPQSTVAWFSFIVLLPYIALPVFLILGFRKQGAQFVPIKFSPQFSRDTHKHSLDGLFRSFKLPPAVSGNRIELLAEGQSSWAKVRTLVQSANHSLDVMSYLIADDPVGRQFVDMLTQRAKSGIRVRLIIDRLGGWRRPKAELVNFRAAGGQVRYFSPFVSMPNKGHFNLRNHRKMIIGDGRQVIAGGRNIGTQYLGPEPDVNRWVDMSYLVEGPVVRTFGDVFASDWRATGPSETEPPIADTKTQVGTALVQLVPSGPDVATDPLHDGLINVIHSARNRVWLATPYFVPTEDLQRALMTASRRGLDVRIMLPAKSNSRMADMAAGAYLRGLDQEGCKILRYQAGMMHAKVGIVDDVAWIGSANFDVRSMLLNFETCLFLYDADVVQQLETWFEKLEKQCVSGIEAARLPRRFVEGMFRLGAPMM